MAWFLLGIDVFQYCYRSPTSTILDIHLFMEIYKIKSPSRATHWGCLSHKLAARVASSLQIYLLSCHWYSPLLKRPNAVKSFSVKSLSLSSISWRLLMFCLSFQICSDIWNYYPDLLLNSHIASTHATHPVPNILLEMRHIVRLGKDIVYRTSSQKLC